MMRNGLTGSAWKSDWEYVGRDSDAARPHAESGRSIIAPAAANHRLITMGRLRVSRQRPSPECRLLTPVVGRDAGGEQVTADRGQAGEPVVATAGQARTAGPFESPGTAVR